MSFVVDDDGGVVVKADIGAICPARLFAGPDDYGFDELRVFDIAIGICLIHDGADDVADVGETAPRTSVDMNDLEPFGSGVVG